MMQANSSTRRPVHTKNSSPKRQHWDAVYGTKREDEVSWYQLEPRQSLCLIGHADIPVDAPVIDVGGGASVLVDRLLDQGFEDLTVLDISAQAIAASRERLGARADAVDWICEDITRFKPRRSYALWHDRALFHFLTRRQDRKKYVEALLQALAPGAQLVISAFAIDGPRKCSGLDIVQYDAEKLLVELGPDFELCEQRQEQHQTPAGNTQLFGWYRLKRI